MRGPGMIGSQAPRGRFVAWMIGAASFCSVAGIQAQEEIAGWVSAIMIAGEAEDEVTIIDIEDGETRSIEVGDPIRRGAQVEVAVDDAAVEIMLISGRRQIIRSRTGETVDVEDAPSSAFARVVSEYFSFGERPGRRAYTYSRGDDDEIRIMPGLESGASALVEGERTIYLTWLGGQPPFTVQLSRAGETVLSLTDVFSREVGREVDLAAGAYALKIEGGGATATFGFDVRPASDLDNTAVPVDRDLGDMGTTIRAYELLTLEEGAWGLEAFEILYEQARMRFRPAIELIRAVQAGAFLDAEE